HEDISLYAVVGSGLTSVIVLCEQLSLNRDRSYPHRPGPEPGPDADCVVCLDRLGEGDHVRRLACRHVFHRGCLDGWLGRLNFSCPLCRAPLVSDESVDQTRRRVAGDLLAWFPAA
ncbi:E3 ubiquitin-protein ligase rha2a, partial [Phtheirospermum japonicum]